MGILPIIFAFSGGSVADSYHGFKEVLRVSRPFCPCPNDTVFVHLGILSMPFLFCMFSPFKKCSFLVKKILLIKQCIDSFLFFFHEFFPFF